MMGAVIVLARELADMRRSPLLLLSMLSLPATMVGVPLLVVWYMTSSDPSTAMLVIGEMYDITGDIPAVVIARGAAHVWLPIFLVMPIFLPILIAAQSIGGERDRRTLEPLLATPVSTLSIIIGKSVAAVVPGIIITWAAALIFVGSLNAITLSNGGGMPLPDPAWLFSVLVLCPLLSLFGNSLAVVVSSRVVDPRAAQNIAAMSVVPLVGLLVAQLAAKVSLGFSFYFGLAVAIAVADVALIAIATLVFDRERLLT